MQPRPEEFIVTTLSSIASRCQPAMGGYAVNAGAMNKASLLQALPGETGA